jgi:DNA-binding transcriptional regulator YdaS (Cro superfamily)
MIEEILKHFGDASALARALKITPPAVAVWVRKGTIPPLRAIQIEVVTGGVFKAVDMPVSGGKLDGLKKN